MKNKIQWTLYSTNVCTSKICIILIKTMLELTLNKFFKKTTWIINYFKFKKKRLKHEQNETHDLIINWVILNIKSYISKYFIHGKYIFLPIYQNSRLNSRFLEGTLVIYTRVSRKNLRIDRERERIIPIPK